MDEIEEQEHSLEIAVVPNLMVNSHHQSLMSSPLRMTQNGTAITTKESMRQ